MKLKMTTPYNPFKDLDRLFTSVSRSVSDTRMPMDLFRDGDTFVVKMDLPGVDPKSIDIDVDDRTLTVRAERAAEVVDDTSEKSGWVSRERSFGTYARQISLGSGLDLGKIEANYTDGVLTLTIPVAEEAKPRKIAVATGTNVVSDAPSA
ncbi:MAG: Hsp20/alpha crystallin family protein [Propionibacteriaceae bacterium]|nr:Hsp20/alpha crystallin family protein [Propionibacteriaceae bacterium]